jgi:Na+/melibiose symporter-like transporter
MQFTGKLTKADLSEVRKMTRSRMYWLKLLAANWYGTLLILVVTWVTISGLLGQTKPNWQAIAIIWAVVAAIILLAVYRTKRAHARELTQLNSSLPDQISLTKEGVKLDGPNGATGFLPWRNFKGWREGRQVVLVDQGQNNRFVILPVSRLSEIERQTIRQFLQSHISPASQ